MQGLRFRGFLLHPAQQRIRASKARFKTVCCGRRFGKTFYVVDEIAGFCFPNDGFKGRPTRGWVVAPTYSLTEEIESYFRICFEELIQFHDRQKHKYVLITGDIIEFKSADSGRLKGAGLDWLIIDEAALVPDLIWTEHLRPTLMDKKGKAIFISTPKGKNWFWEVYCFGDNPDYDEYESFHYTSWDNPFIDRKELEDIIKEMPDLVYKQEIMAEFLDDATAFFRNIQNCIRTDAEDEPKNVINRAECDECGHVFRYEREEDTEYIQCPVCRSWVNIFYASKDFYYIGVDLAKKHDFTVITVVKYNPDVDHLEVVEIDRFNNITWPVQKARIINKYNTYQGMTYVDGTGLGDPIVDDLLDAGVPAHSVVFNVNRNKSNILNRLSIIFERELITIPNDPVLVNELRQYQAEMTPGGTWRYSAPEGKYDDCVISLALSVCAAPIMGMKPAVEVKEEVA